jgi:pimeloyl-ACP methyl ester carboxylesterase
MILGKLDISCVSKCEGIPFVFQHGLGSNLNQSQTLLENLGKVQLISMDMPGHGNAPLPHNTQPSFDIYADHVVTLMHKLKIKKAILGGISMGAGIALNIAVRFPDKISGLVLIRPAWLDQNRPENLEILIEAANYIRLKNGKEAFMQRPKFKSIQDDLPKAAQSVLGVFEQTQRDEIPIVLESMVQDRPFENLELLKHIVVPCLVVGNEDDPLHPFEMAREIHHRIQSSQLHKVISRYMDDARHQYSIKKLVTKFITDHEELLERE